MKGKIDKGLMIRLLTAMLIPFVTCLIYCKLRGTSLFSLYMPNCINNDSLFYYKVVETALAKNRGFFGYNDSRALIGFFPVWSPFLFFPWIVWGAIFGWMYSSVFIFNIMILSVSLAVFVFLTDMDIKGLLTLFIMFMLFPGIPIHILNMLPETMVASMLIFFFAFAINEALFIHRRRNIIFMLITGMYMTVFRPFLLVLLLYPAFILVREKRSKAVIPVALSFIVPVMTYFICNRFFAAQYFELSIDMSIFRYLIHGQIGTMIRHILGCIRGFWPDLKEYIKGAFEYGLTAGTHYVVTAVIMLLMLFDFGKSNKARNVYILYIITCIVTITANILLYRRVNEGGRHFFSFAVVGCLMCCLRKSDVKGMLEKGIIISLLTVFVVRGAMYPTDYDITPPDEVLRKDISYWNEVFAEKIDLTGTSGYDNTFLWVFSEETGEGNKLMDFRQLFALPKGCGISCAKSSYVANDFDAVESRYIACMSGGNIDKLCIGKNLEEIGRTDDVVIYRRN